MATYSYGKKTKVRASRVKAVGPTSAELERQTASMASYNHDVGITTPDVQKQQLAEKLRNARRNAMGRDGGKAAWETPSQIPKDRLKPRGWQDSVEGTEDPQRVQALRGRRRKGNRYYRTD